MYIVGLDVSSRDTGVCEMGSDGSVLAVHSVKRPKHLRLDHHIIDFYYDELRSLVKACRKNYGNDILFALEDFLYGSMRGKAVLRVAIASVFAHWLRNKGFTVIAVAPTSVKKEIAGSGRASKGEVMKAVHSLTDLYTDNDNIADAVAVSIYAFRYLNGNRKLTINAMS